MAMFPCHFTCISKSNLKYFRRAFVTVSIAIFCAMASGQEPAKPNADAQSGMRTGAPRIDEDEAGEIASELAYGLARKAYRL